MQSAGTVYDANGNLIKLPWVDLEYDVENRLAKASSGVKGTELYGYDPANRRVWRRTAAGSEEVYLYAPTTGQRLATFALNTDAHGALSLTLVDTNVYFGGRLVQSRGDGVLADRLGAVRGRGNAAKAAVSTKYLPLGEELPPTAEDTDKFGRYVRDSVSGLDYAEQRYYSSAAGRFVTPDPYEGSVRLGDPDSWNRYSFVSNDPVNRVDPRGLDDSDEWGGSGASWDWSDPNAGVSEPTGGGGGGDSWDPGTNTVTSDPDPVPYDPSPSPLPIYFAPSPVGNYPVYSDPDENPPSTAPPVGPAPISSPPIGSPSWLLGCSNLEPGNVLWTVMTTAGAGAMAGLDNGSVIGAVGGVPGTLGGALAGAVVGGVIAASGVIVSLPLQQLPCEALKP